MFSAQERCRHANGICVVSKHVLFLFLLSLLQPLLTLGAGWLIGVITGLVLRIVFHMNAQAFAMLFIAVFYEVRVLNHIRPRLYFFSDVRPVDFVVLVFSAYSGYVAMSWKEIVQILTLAAVQ